MPEQGWFDDPTGVFPQRLWDGSAWTDQVKANGVRATSPPDSDPADARQVLARMTQPPTSGDDEPAGSEVPGIPGASVPPPPAREGQSSELPAGETANPGTDNPGPDNPGTDNPGPDNPGTDNPGPDNPGTDNPGPDNLGNPDPASSHGSTGQPQTATDTPAAPVDNRFLVAIICVPVVAFLIEILVGANPAFSTLVTVVAIAANTAFAVLDMRANPKVTDATSGGALLSAAVLLMPVYVWLRQRALGQSQAWFVAYLAAFAVIVSVLLTTGALNEMDGPFVEDAIEDWARDLGAASVTVSCPTGEPARAGHRFLCDIRVEGENGLVRVEVLNSNGDFEWVLTG